MPHPSILRHVPMFSALEESELNALLTLMQKHTFVSGQTILQEGEVGDSIHVLMEGEAQIWTLDENRKAIILDEVGPGAFFGELALLTGEPRSASVRAIGDATTLSLSHDEFKRFLESNAHACFNVVTVLGQRLGRSSALLRITTRNVNDIEQEQITTGQRIADGFTTAMGSWAFILIQTLLLVIYILWNVYSKTTRWDPYPFLLMSLILSFQAAYSAPIIMMSQNRQTVKDRLMAENNYQVNIKASAEIGLLLKRMDEMEQHLSVRTKSDLLEVVVPEQAVKNGKVTKDTQIVEC